MRCNAMKMCAVALSPFLLLSSFLTISFSTTLPHFFAGMYATYEFKGDITRHGQTVYELTSIKNWTVLDLEKNTAKVDMGMVITHVEGVIPDLVAEAYNPFPNASWRKTLEFNLNRSYWWYYLNDTANDLLKYMIGEETVESEVGLIRCYYLRLRRQQQEWDAFYDKSSGILISLREAFWVDDYSVSYNKSIVDTNAQLSVGTAEALDYTMFLFLVISVAIIVSIGFLTLKKRRKFYSNMEKSSSVSGYTATGSRAYVHI